MDRFEDHIQSGVLFRLLPEKAIFLPVPKILLVSDLHLGKANHFRRSGIPVPPAVNLTNTENLSRIIMQYRPERFVVIGDLFHSHYNSEWDVFGGLTAAFPGCSFELVSGNHDILGAHQYGRFAITVHRELELFPGMWLRHIPDEKQPKGQYQVCGHIHPAISLEGKGRQSMVLPCFWFGSTTAFLPAFGAFTGSKTITPKKGDRIYAIASGRVIAV